MTDAANPRVSIIIPAYKAVDTLEKAVRSVIAQTEPDWELLIVHDCSPDATGQLADQLAPLDARIRVIHQPENRGKPMAMNTGTAAARGRWIALLDSDDWYAPARLKTLLDAGDAADVAMVADNQVLYDGKAQAAAGLALPELKAPTRLDLHAFLASSNATASFDYGMLKPVFRADFIRAHRLEYYAPARLGEDYLILLCFFAAGGTALLLPDALYYYLQPFGTISRQWAQEGRQQYNFALLEQINRYGIEQVRGRLAPDQLAVLERRGRGIAALDRLHQLRMAAQRKNLPELFRLALTAPLPFWQLLGQRLQARLRR